MDIRTAVIPIAGLGTRFLPASRAVPKVMLPVLDTPVLHVAVQEALDAGVTRVVFIVSPGQEGVDSYFRRDLRLESALSEEGSVGLLERVRSIPEPDGIQIVVQSERLGLGHAILLARETLGDEAFAVLLPDDVIWDDTPTIGRMMGVLGERGGPVLAVKEVPDEAVSSLGIIEPRSSDGRVYELAGVVEKPRLENAPSNLAIIGRYVLTPDVFDALERTPPGAGGEIQLTDAIASLMDGRNVYGYRFPGFHIDVGTPLGLVKASVAEALRRTDMAPAMREWLRQL